MNEKKLRRSKSNRALAGVCGGIAEYCGIDPVVVRVLWVVGSLLAGCGVLAYIICIFVIPNEY